MELSLLCGQQIYLCLYDPEYDRMIQFMSHEEFSLEVVYNRLQLLKNMKTKLSLRSFTNEDFYKVLSSQKIKCNHSDDDDEESDDVAVVQEEDGPPLQPIPPIKIDMAKDKATLQQLTTIGIPKLAAKAKKAIPILAATSQPQLA